MIARAAVGLSFALLLSLGAAPASAQSPPPPPPPKETEVAEVLHERTSTSRLEVRLEDAEQPLTEERATSVSARYRRAKTATGWTVKFSAWERKEGSQSDTCLSGAEVLFVEDAKFAAPPTWSLVPEPAKAGEEPQPRALSEGAKRYLEGCARELHDPLAGLLLGADPGTSRWKPQLGPLAARLLPSGRVDLARSSAEGEREADPNRERSRGRVSLVLQATRFPGMGAWVVKGGAWEAKVELGWPGSRTPLGPTTSWRLKAEFAGEARDQRPDGAGVKLRVKAEELERWVVTPEDD